LTKPNTKRSAKKREALQECGFIDRALVGPFFVRSKEETRQMQEVVRDDEVWTRRDVAEWLRLSPRTVDYLKATKQIPFRKIGGSVRFSKRRLMQWLAESSSY
jgi:excisionase family DNA binding protein